MRDPITDATGAVTGYIEKVGDNTNAYDATGALLGYANSTGTYTADGIRKSGSNNASLLLGK